MKILVTGGMGFIGSNFIRLLLKEENAKIVNYDALTYAGNPENLKDVEKNPNYSFVKGDVCDLSKVRQAMRGCDQVVHFAAESHVDRSIEDSSAFVRTNVLGTQVLLDAAKQEKIEKFLYVSTDEVYGSIEQGKFNETDPLMPRSPYAASKAGGDLLAQSYFVTHKLPVVVTRSSNNFGPYQYPEKIIPLFILNALENKKLPIYGSGKNVRDWIYVEDNCQAILTVLKKGVAGEVYNAGGENEFSNIQLTEKLLEILGKDEDLIEFVEDRKGHDKRYALTCEKIKELGWKNKYDFEKALSKTVQWYSKNENWWKPLRN
ncbi:MAG: dTDP-glucose 4,6-dehydratase [Candidatus Micrarchaeia archaeon]